MNKSAQLSTIDLFAAISIASLLLIAIFSTYHYYNNILERKMLYNDIQLTAFAAVDYLVKNPGIPNNWEENPSNIERIGLASKSLTISTDKINNLSSIDYETQKQLLNLVGYEFNLTIVGNGVSYTTGTSLSDKSYIVNAKRIITYQGKIASVNLMLGK